MAHTAVSEVVPSCRTAPYMLANVCCQATANPPQTTTHGAKQTCHRPAPKGLSPRRLRQFFQLRISDSEFGEAPAALAGAEFAKGRAGPSEFSFV